jgi:uncharacterized repeat protein (TIGR03803 family)
MRSQRQDRIRVLEINSRAVTIALTLTLFALIAVITPAATAQSNTVYAITEAGVFGTLNLTTGAFTELGNSGVTLAGLAALGGGVYGGLYEGSTLYQVNPSNGNLTGIGAASFNYADFGSTTSSLYGTSFASNGHNLYSINAVNGSATLIGPIGLPACYCAMSSGGSTLYFASDTGSGSVLYSLNTATGAATPIGNTGVNDIDSMIVTSGVLYANTEAGALYTLSTSTGTATFVSNTGVDLWGMALTFRVIHNFSGGQDGANPNAGVTMDGAGNLYGTAYSGGTSNDGTVYRLQNKGASWIFSPLYSFRGGADGANPYSRVILGPDGLLYGTTYGYPSNGAGTVFNLRPPPRACTAALCPWNETVLYSFTGGADGFWPRGDLIFDQSRNIYGTTQSGTVYELTLSNGSWAENTLYGFSGPDGSFPHGGVILDNAGSLYGTTYLGGLASYGVAFQLVRRIGVTETNLYNFGDGTDGGYLNAGLIFDHQSSGNLYGATSNGGTGGGGTVFELSPPGTWTKLTTLYSFAGTSGQCGPWASLFLDPATGSLYGTTLCDGAYGYGNVFELSPSNGGWIYKDLYDFTGGNDGANPVSNVLLHLNGKLYGTASAGGTQNAGVVWEITP